MAELSVDTVRAFVERVAAQRGWRLNPDPQHLQDVFEGLMSNRRRYDYYLCPCRDGSGDRDSDADVICPCLYAQADLEEHGHCYCGLFLDPRFAASAGAVQPIPERRLAGPRLPSALAVFGKDLCSLKELVRGIHDLECELKRSHGLTLNEGLCLCCVSKRGHSPGDCARQMGLSASRISRILNALEKKGLLERRSLPDDHRSTELSLTDKGRARLQTLRGSGFTFSRLDPLPSARSD